ncbi:MAG: serpin family protein, partial [Clostridia bacterium]|nr:serpin family protein [Clostridia bacterium]
MRKSAAALAVLICILAGIATGITGCAEQCVTDSKTTAETIEAIETLDPVETDAGSGETVPAVNLTHALTANPMDPADITDEEAVAWTQFALDLAAQQDEQFLISPVSVLSALAMIANGADGDTLAQTEEVLGLDRDSLNRTVHSYRMTHGDRISLANSVWFRNHGFEPDPSFLQTAVDYSGADLFATPFDDSTVNDVNRWISEKTGGMIPQMLDKIRPDTVMYLINAVYFEHQWERVYEGQDRGTFTAADGTVQDVSTLESMEESYFEDAHATGFAKPYLWCGYSFIALLPEEGMTPAEYLAQLTGEQLHTLLKNPEKTDVRTVTPMFQTEYEADLIEDLTALGMTDIFDSVKADLSGLGTASGNLYVSDV